MGNCSGSDASSPSSTTGNKASSTTEKKAKKAGKGKYTLVYFNGRGRCECIRLVLAAAGCDYEDRRVEKEDWPALKPNTPFGSLPYMEIDGQELGNSMAILRYLAKEHGLAGKTNEEEVMVDALACQATDIREGVLPIHFLPDGPEKDEKMKKFEGENLVASLDRLEGFLKMNNDGDGYLVGDSMTYADTQFFSVMEIFIRFGGMSIEDKHPKLAALYKKIEDNPRIAAWVAKRPESDF